MHLEFGKCFCMFFVSSSFFFFTLNLICKKHPERVLKTVTAVTSVSFSTASASLLAVGLLDGSIMIYDLRKRQNTPVLQNGYVSFLVLYSLTILLLCREIQHHDPVWDLKWVDRGAERGESLVSVSTDGRILMWDIKKGLEVRSELMRLRRVPVCFGYF